MRGATVAAVIGKAAAAGGGVSWYPYSADNWATKVTKSDYVCKDGTAQSPVNFPSCGSALERPEPVITWKKQEATLENNGHTVQLNADKPGEGGPGTMTFDIGGLEKEYQLVQCHFHHGSEHTIDGTQTPFESHCVHALLGGDSIQRYGVFGVFFDVGAENSFLAEFVDQLPDKPARRLAQEASVPVRFDVFGNPMNQSQRILAGSDPVSLTVDFPKLKAGLDLKKYWNYHGSLTTPPCLEAVDFYIFMQKMTLSTAQLSKFQAKIGSPGNFRPPQPLNSRTIYGCTVMPPKMQNKPWYPYSAQIWSTAVGKDTQKVCASGSKQSPIDFSPCAVPRSQTPISVTWASSQTVALINKGYTVQLNIPAGTSPGGMSVSSHDYTLAQCHFHWGSEHFVGGRQFPFEVHCVHVDNDKSEGDRYGVFGQFYELGDENVWLKAFEDQLPDAPARRLQATSPLDEGLNLFGDPMRRLAAYPTSSWTGPIDFKGLYGDNPLNNFWNYEGSFTTPPCTEAVKFFILMEPATMTEGQLEIFKEKIGQTTAGGNYRPPQPLHARVVSGCSQSSGIETVVSDAAKKAVPTKLNELVEEALEKHMGPTLKEIQGEQTGMLIALVVLGCVIVLLMVVATAMVVMIKKANPSQAREVPVAAGDSVEPKPVGNAGAGDAPPAASGTTVEDTV